MKFFLLLLLFYSWGVLSPHHSRFDKKFGMVLQNVKTSSQAKVSLPSSNHIYIPPDSAEPHYLLYFAAFLMSAAGFFGSLYNFTVSTCRVINKNKNNLNMHRDYRVEEATACRSPSMSLPFRLQYLPIIMRVRSPFKKHDNHLSIFTDYFYVPFLFLFLTIFEVLRKRKIVLL
jgi:hypothetical protein